MITKQIVEMCDGSISVQSEGVGKGSDFIFEMYMENAQR